MSESIGQLHTLRESMATLLAKETSAVARDWIASVVFCHDEVDVHARAHLQSQAERFLQSLAEALRRDDGIDLPDSREIERVLQSEFPLVYRVSTLVTLAELLLSLIHI